jgi:riboflavin synthase
MFTGIITDTAIVTAITSPQLTMRRLEVQTQYDSSQIVIGASIAHDGCCLTVISTWKKEGVNYYAVEASQHTLDHTTIGHWRVGQRVNLERALCAGDELGGHIVSGHVDGVAHISAMQTDGQVTHYSIKPPAHLLPFIATKGSVALDGTSLTVTWAKGDAFGLTLIPHSLQVTNWGEKKIGDALNIEIDMLARYVQRMMECKS